jgi:hypothetical protein
MSRGFQRILPILSEVRGPLSGGAILNKIWDMINQFPRSVHTSGSGLFLTPYLYFPFREHIVWKAVPMALWNFETMHITVLIRKRRYKFLAPLELAP